MAMAYATLISRNAVTGYTIDNVTNNLKDEVRTLLRGMGLDDYGKPLENAE